ncbi:MAG TPA: chitin disaccharide deacetylase [Firmicutes bacterium]|nr:chitin disaccharide deacetylase [Bacillota bacterium]
MTTIIVNADDFGLSEAVNYGIVSAHQHGIVKSTTMMANMSAVEHGLALLKQNPELKCGIHLTLSCGKPVLENLKTIVDESGNFHRRITNELIETFDINEVYEEFKAQIKKLQDLGIDLSHFDSHHHVHTLKGLEPVIRRLVEEYQLPIRGGFEYSMDYDKVVPVIDAFYKETVEEAFFEKNLNMIAQYEFVDLMTHPAFVDDALVQTTSYALDRIKEHKILTAETVKNYLTKHNITIGSYKAL